MDQFTIEEMLSAGLTLMIPGKHNNKPVIYFLTNLKYQSIPELTIIYNWLPGIEYKSIIDRDIALETLDSLESFINIIEFDKTINTYSKMKCTNPSFQDCAIFNEMHCFGCPVFNI